MKATMHMEELNMIFQTIEYDDSAKTKMEANARNGKDGGEQKRNTMYSDDE